MSSDPIYRILERAIRNAAAQGEEGWMPPVDVYETDEGAVIVLEVAGIARGDLEIHVQEGVLCIAGERREFIPGGAVRLHNLEIDRGRFFRRVIVPAGFELDRSEARLENGLLFVTIPRLPSERRTIEVK